MKCVDIFSGCGGLGLGFMNAGFDIVAAFDNWLPAITVYKDNFKHPIYLQDLSDTQTTAKMIGTYQPDIIIGGPPCQDFSSAGKRDETQGRAELTYSYASIIDTIRPTWFVMENVDRIKSSQILQEVIQQFNDMGYGLTAVILDASLCEVPQSRTRFFLIGKLGEGHNFLLPSLQENLADTPMTIRDYLGDSLGLNYYYRHPRNYSRRGIFSIDEPSPTVRGVNRPVPPNYTKHPADPADIPLEQIRPLTTIERSYLQTFPSSFRLQGTKTNLEQMIGNAVPVNMAAYVAKSILNYSKNSVSLNKRYHQADLFSHCQQQAIILPQRALKPVLLPNFLSE
ncbi:MAG: hypothetical protein RJA83_1034 [Pseudomonadota bacterium]|jgi:DNA (cytosine-5)-methyltransferase 1